MYKNFLLLNAVAGIACSLDIWPSANLQERKAESLALAKYRATANPALAIEQAITLNFKERVYAQVFILLLTSSCFLTAIYLSMNENKDFLTYLFATLPAITILSCMMMERPLKTRFFKHFTA